MTEIRRHRCSLHRDVADKRFDHVIEISDRYSSTLLRVPGLDQDGLASTTSLFAAARCYRKADRVGRIADFGNTGLLATGAACARRWLG